MQKVMTFDIEKSEDEKTYRLILKLPAVPVWNAGLSQSDVRAMERVQKMALTIILGDAGFFNYDVAMTILEQDTLVNRRETICLNFAKKCIKNVHHKDMFTLAGPGPNTREVRKPFVEPRCRTNRFFKSPTPYLTRLLNNN